MTLKKANGTPRRPRGGPRTAATTPKDALNGAAIEKLKELSDIVRAAFPDPEFDFSALIVLNLNGQGIFAGMGTDIGLDGCVGFAKQQVEIAILENRLQILKGGSDAPIDA